MNDKQPEARLEYEEISLEYSDVRDALMDNENYEIKTHDSWVISYEGEDGTRVVWNHPNKTLDLYGLGQEEFEELLESDA